MVLNKYLKFVFDLFIFLKKRVKIMYTDSLLKLMLTLYELIQSVKNYTKCTTGIHCKTT